MKLHQNQKEIFCQVRFFPDDLRKTLKKFPYKDKAFGIGKIIFRQDMICVSGRLRDTVYFCIFENEWRNVKENLLRELGKIS